MLPPSRGKISQRFYALPSDPTQKPSVKGGQSARAAQNAPEKLAQGREPRYQPPMGVRGVMGEMRRKRQMRRGRSAAAGALGGLLLAAGLARPAAADPTPLPTSFGWNYGQVETTRVAALGGALRAAGSGTSAMFLNPASMAETRVYHIEALVDASPEMGRVLAGAVIADSMMNRYRLAGGVSVVGGILNPSGANWSTLDVRAALAYPITDKVFLGITGRYATVTQGSKLAPQVVSEDESGDDVVNTLHLDAFTFDAGATIKAGESIYIALLGQNLGATHRGTFPMMLGGGVGYGTDDVTFEVDALADLHAYEEATARIMAGGEILVADHVPIRVGYRFDQGAKVHALSGGLGYMGKEWAVEASVRRTLSDPGATSIFVGLAYYLESSSVVRAATSGYE